MTRDELDSALRVYCGRMRTLWLIAGPMTLTLIVILFVFLVDLRDFYVAHLGRTAAPAAFAITMHLPILLVMVPMWFLERRVIREAGGKCERCGRSVFLKWRQVAATGACPHCRAAILEE